MDNDDDDLEAPSRGAYPFSIATVGKQSTLKTVAEMVVCVCACFRCGFRTVVRNGGAKRSYAPIAGTSSPLEPVSACREAAAA